MKQKPSALQQFYTRLLRCRRQEIILVVLFLGFVLLFQLTAPSMFRGYRDNSDEPTAKLSHQEALWEVMFLQEQLKKSREEVATLKKQIEALHAEPERPPKQTSLNLPSNEFLNTILYQTFDRHGLYAINSLHEEPSNHGSIMPGLRGALIDEFNSLGDYIFDQYNTNPKGGIFRKVLRGKTESGNMTVEHFQTGIYRYIPQVGAEYQLFFRDPSPEDIQDHYLYKVGISRSFEQPQDYSLEHINSRSKVVNIVVPLKGRLQTFNSFLLNLVQIKASSDFKLYLTVVYFGSKAVQNVNLLIDNAKKLGFVNINLINLSSEHFTRGAGIQKGVQSWKGGNEVMFLCDVDMILKKEFFERCVIYTEPGRSVYYPVVFSLFNPDIVTFFTNNTSANQSKEDDFTISRHRGLWRDFGFGMLCVHKSDYFKVGGYRQWNKKNVAPQWGYEDVDLYKRFVKHPKLTVIRAPDPGIAHRWHPKTCPQSMSHDRLKQCESTMVVTEGNREQLGLLHFNKYYKDFIKANRSFSFR